MLVSEELRQCCDGSDSAASYDGAVSAGVLPQIRHQSSLGPPVPLPQLDKTLIYIV